MSETLLLCTDLDRTLLPNGMQPESPLARRRFAELAARDDLVLAYVTGRDRRLVEQAMSKYQLPQPDKECEIAYEVILLLHDMILSYGGIPLLYFTGYPISGRQ